MVDLFREDDLASQADLAPDATLDNSLDGTEVGAEEVGAQVDPSGNTGTNNLLRSRRCGGVEAV